MPAAAVGLAAAIVLAALALLPAWRLLVARDGPPARGRRDAALDLHRAQLRELDRDAALGLLDSGEEGGARLELHRRLLAADALPTAPAVTGGRTALAATLAAIAVGAAILYAIGGHPSWPAEPLEPRLVAIARADADADATVARIRAGLATLDPHSAQARAGDILLGRVQARLGRWAEAASAWRLALAIGFEPTLAFETAEADMAATDRVSDDDALLLRRALAAAPNGAPWRLAALARLAEKEHE